jgi:hypothetical protein
VNYGRFRCTYSDALKEAGWSAGEIDCREAGGCPLTAEQERNAFIDGNAGLEREGVTIMLDTGAGDEKQDPVPAKVKLMPITNMTEQDAGASFVVGVGGTTSDQQVQPKRAPPAIAPRTPSKGGGKSKRK